MPEGAVEPPLDIVYIKIAESYRRSDGRGFMVTWGIRKFGFGSFTFWQQSGENWWSCDNEAIGWSLFKEILEFWLANGKKQGHLSSRRWTKRMIDYRQVIRDILATPDLVKLEWYDETKYT